MPSYDNQYLVYGSGKQPETPDGFDAHSVGTYTVEADSRLPVETHTDGDRAVALVGDVVAPRSQSCREWLTSTVGDGIEETLISAQDLTGRYVLIVDSPDGAIVAPDAFAHKPIFHHTKEAIASSSGKLLIEACDITPGTHPDVEAFVQSDKFGSKQVMVGDRTVAENVNRVLSNHVLSLSKQSVFRRPLEHPDPDSPARYISDRIKDSLSTFSDQKDLLVPITAGLDTRVLLACLRDRIEDVDLYTLFSGATHEYDVEIPRQMAADLDFDYTSHFVSSLSEEFQDQLADNHLWFRDAPNMANIEFHYRHRDIDRELNTIGIGGEILRTYYELPEARKPVSSEDAAALMKYPDTTFAEDELREWLPGAREYAETNDFRVLDLLYWEQRMSRWGARITHVQDIALRTISPFNNYNVLLAGLSTPTEQRKPPNYDLSRDVIRAEWPELLDYPVNPPESKTREVKLQLYQASRTSEPLFRARNWLLY